MDSVQRLVLKGIHAIHWRHILVLSVFFMALHFFILSDRIREPSPVDLTTSHADDQSLYGPNTIAHSDGFEESNSILNTVYSPPADAVPHLQPPPPAQAKQPPITNNPGGNKPLGDEGLNSMMKPQTGGPSDPDWETILPNVSLDSKKQPVKELAPETDGNLPPASNAASTKEVGTSNLGAAAKKVSDPQDEYVAICMAVKNQALDLPEFFIHHFHHLGIRRFYIMDDGSEPPLSSVTDYGVPRSVLTFEFQDPEFRTPDQNQQLLIYSRCMTNYGKRHTWIAFLDADEFLETTGNETLKEILVKFEKDRSVGALGVNWQMHTSSGVLQRPESARKSFVECIWDDVENGGKSSNNSHVKSIVRTEMAEKPFNPHTWVLKEGTQTVGEHGDVVESEAWRMPITRDRIALHHYAGKSREEYEEKMHRGNAMDDPKGEGFWNSLEFGLPHVNCSGMAKYHP